MAVMGQRQRVTDNVLKLLHLAKLFDLPTLVTEQYPRWLGPTLTEVQDVLPVYAPIEKLHFNCCDVDLFNERLAAKEQQNIIVCGVEAHICVWQTCASLLNRKYTLHVPQDAVDSRTAENWQVGLQLLQTAGAIVSSTETIIYQILQKAGSKEFKSMLKLIK